MMAFSAHYSDRDPAYFMAPTWPEAASFGMSLGTMITLYWLADEQDPGVATVVSKQPQEA